MNGQIREVAKKLTHSNRLKKLIVVLVAVIVALGLVMPMIERPAPRPTIKNEMDGIYFVVTTVTGVGYGDMVPVTTEGKVAAMIVEIVGVILFGSIAAFVSVELLRYQEDFYVRRMMERMDNLEIKMDEVKKHLDYLVKK